MTDSQPIVIFDGECGLCNLSVRYIRKLDRKGLFKYIALQSLDAGDFKWIDVHPTKMPDSVVFIHDSRVYFRSEAAIRILASIGGIYRLSIAFLIIPRRIRDYFYNLIATNRHRWFKNDSCCV